MTDDEIISTAIPLGVRQVMRNDIIAFAREIERRTTEAVVQTAMDTMRAKMSSMVDDALMQTTWNHAIERCAAVCDAMAAETVRNDVAIRATQCAAAIRRLSVVRQEGGNG